MTEKAIKGEFVCVVCPNGCLIEAEYTTGGAEGAKLLSFSGNRCNRGETWLHQEIEKPMRTLTTSVSVRGGDFPLVSVRTKKPIPLEKIIPVMEEIRKRTLEAPLSIGQVILKNPVDTDTEIIVTREVAALQE
ncbi:MAG: DUF1667 domain-containing protein [Synergistaceae bacterium]|jgi:CxxC motif-containing protein|nr:DUF1667 domain-containing protein [Synergistaceae bacterium]